MFKSLLFITLLILSLILAHRVNASNTEYQKQLVFTHVENVKVFTNNNHRLLARGWLRTSVKLNIFNLDDLTTLENELTRLVQSQIARTHSVKTLSNMPEKQQIDAYSVAFSKIQDRDDVKSLIRQLENASLSQLYLNIYQIKALPAIVINDKFVMYGYSDLHSALDYFFQHSGSKR